MARKVFISFLGATEYTECTYTKQGCNDFSDTNPYIQIATLKYLNKYVSKWEGEDIALILLTSKAETDNWQPHGSERGLKSRMDEMQFPYDTVKDLPVGDNESELISIFMKVFEKLHTGDELYFDITHAFRFLPMLIMVLTNYSKFAKTCKVKWISYGKTVSPFTKGTIVELNKLSILQDWTTGAADFVDNGNVDKLIKLTNEDFSSSLSANINILPNELERNNRNTFSEFTDTLSKVIDEIKMCRCVDVIEAVNYKKLLDLKDSIELSGDVQPFDPILKKIMDSLIDFSPERSVINGIHAANWCVEHSLYQQAITYIEETIVSFICDQYGINLRDHDKRKIVSDSFNVLFGLMKKKDWETEDNLQLCHQLLEEDFLVRNYYKQVCAIKDLRNDINHAGMRKEPFSADIMKEKIQLYVDGFSRILKSTKIQSSHNTKQEKIQIINISDQPLSSSEREKLQELKLPYDIKNIDFPSDLETLDKEKDAKLIRIEVNTIIDRTIEMSDTCPCYLFMPNKLVNKINKTKNGSIDALKERAKLLKFNFVSSINDIIQKTNKKNG